MVHYSHPPMPQAHFLGTWKIGEIRKYGCFHFLDTNSGRVCLYLRLPTYEMIGLD